MYGKSQTDIGKVLNLSKQTISSMENGKRRITAFEVEKIAEFFNLEWDIFSDKKKIGYKII